MKLHLPKVLFAAVVAALTCVQQADAATYYLNAGAGNGVNISASFKTESGGSTSVAWQKFCSGQSAYDGPHQLVIDQERTVNNKVKIDFAPFNVTGFTVTAAGNYLYREATNDSIIIGNTAEGAGAQSSSFSESFTLELQGNKNGVIELVGTQTWTITSGKNVNLIGSVTNTGNTTINGGTISVVGSLTNNGSLSFGENTTLTLSSDIAGSDSSTLVFGTGAKIVLDKYSSSEPLDNLAHETYGFRTDRTVDLLSGNITANREVTVTVNGTDYTMAADGTVADLSDYTYYINGAVNASDINDSGDSIGTDTYIRMTGGTLTMDEDFTVNGTALITGTTISGEAEGGKLIVADGATVQVNSTGCILKSNMEIAAGGTLEFLGTGQDATDYDTHGRTITVNGLMDVGTTRQTVGGWIFDMTGGTIQGAGQSTQSSIGLDFHSAGNDKPGKINAKAAVGATTTSPTVSTISTKVRYNGLLNVDVEENARLDMTGVIVAGNKLTKSGAGILRLANDGNDYSDKAFDVTGGTVELRDNAVTMNGAVTVNNGAKLLLQQTTNASANTLANVTLDNGALLVQNKGGKFTTNITKLTVGTGGAIVGTGRDTTFHSDSYNGDIKIGSLVAKTDADSTITFVKSSNSLSTTTVFINGGPGDNETAFKGTVKVQVDPVANSSSSTVRKIDLDLASDTALANAVVELGGGTGDETTYTTNLVLGATQTAVKGIKDADSRKSAGDVIIRTGDVPSTLTINTAGNSYSTKSGVKENISLVKSGEGTQSFGGDMSAFNKAITVNAGTLEFLKEATNLNVTQLTVAGGNLTVKGTVNTSDTLSYTSGKIDANLNVNDSTALTLNGTVDMTGTLTLGNSLTLNGSKLTEILALTEGGRVDLFSGVSTLILGGTNYQAGALTEDNGLAFGDCFTYAAPMSATSGGDIYLGFDANGMVYAGKLIPEPTTATLSLLALAALAARRRRR